MDFSQALKIMVDIVLENVPSKTLRVQEICTGADASASILNTIQEIIGFCPQRKVKLFLPQFPLPACL